MKVEKKENPSNASRLEQIGIDISLVEKNLRFSYEQRLVVHQQAYELVLELEKAGQKLREKLK